MQNSGHGRHAKERLCKTVVMQNIGRAKVWSCKSLVVQKFGRAKAWFCYIVFTLYLHCMVARTQRISGGGYLK